MPNGPTLLAVRSRRSRRLTVTCPDCGTANDARAAVWCGHCGQRLRAAATPGAPSVRGGDPAAARRLVVPLVAVALVLLLVVPSALRRGSPPAHGQSLRGDAARTGVIAEVAPAPPTQVAWSAMTATAVVPSVRLATGSRAVLVSSGPDVEVLDMQTGELLRSASIASTRMRFERARIVDGLALVPDPDLPGQVLATDVATGEFRWATPRSEDDLAHAIVLDGDVILPALPRGLVRIDGEDGRDRWNVDLGAQLGGAGVLRMAGTTAGRVAAVTVNPAGAVPELGAVGVELGLVGVDARSGEVAWSVPLGIEEGLSPVAMTMSDTEADGWLAHVALDRGPAPVVVVRRLSTGRESVALGFVGDLLGLAVVGDLIVVSASESGTVAFDAGSGQGQGWAVDRVPGDLVTGPDEVVVVLRSRGSGDLTVIGLDGAVLADITDADPEVPVALHGGILTIATRSGTVAGRDITGSRLWQRNVPAAHLASIATDGRLVAINDQGGTLVLDGRNGRQVSSLSRRVTTGGPTIEGSVAIDAGAVVAVPLGPSTDELGLVGLEAETAVARWNKDGDSPAVLGPITLSEGLAFVPVGDQVHGYALEDGRRVFAENAGTPRGPIVLVDDLVITTARAGLCAGQVQCPDAVRAVARRRAPGITQGPREVRWNSTLPVCGPAAARDGVVVVPTDSGPAAIDLADGSTRWRAATSATCDPIALGPTEAVTTVGTSIHAWDLTTGAPTWSRSHGQTPSTAPVIAGSQVIVCTTDGEMLALDLATGNVQWQYRLPAAAAADPVVVDGRWVVLLRDGRVVGLR